MTPLIPTPSVPQKISSVEKEVLESFPKINGEYITFSTGTERDTENR